MTLCHSIKFETFWKAESERHVMELLYSAALVFRSPGQIRLAVAESTYTVDEVHQWDTSIHAERLPERLGSAVLLMNSAGF